MPSVWNKTVHFFPFLFIFKSVRAANSNSVTITLSCIFHVYCVSPRTPRLQNVDRSKAKQFSVTCNNVTVIITDYPYQPTPDVRSSDSHISSDASDTNSSTHLQDLQIDSPAGSSTAANT